MRKYLNNITPSIMSYTEDDIIGVQHAEIAGQIHLNHHFNTIKLFIL